MTPSNPGACPEAYRDTWTGPTPEGFAMKETPLPKGWHRISRPKPPCHSYHYSNPASQNALVCETADFPAGYNPATHDLFTAYSDRIAGWDRKRYERACAIAGTGDQGWAQRLPSLGDEKLIEFAKVALNIEDRTVTAVRIIHAFNVSNGYSCPVVMAVFEKKSEAVNA